MNSLRTSSLRLLQTGFTLITALFLLVVVALFSVYMINFSSVQHTTLAYSVQGARAMQAARSGLEWGIYQAIRNGQCAPVSAFNSSGAGSLDNFTIELECQSSAHIEAATSIITYQLTASAEIGSFGSLDYVYRSLRATVSNQPP